MEAFAGERHRKTLTFTRQDATTGRPFSHHGDQVEALGKGPEVTKKRRERRERGGGWAKEAEKEAMRKRGEEGGVVMEERDKGGRWGGSEVCQRLMVSH